MKILNVSFLLISINLLCDDGSIISSHTLKNQMDRAQSVQKVWIINVLPKSIHKDCTIPGSINIPLHMLTKKVKKWPRSRSIVVYCAHAQSPLAGYAYQELVKLGFDHVQMLSGGLQAWKNHDFVTVGSCKAKYLKN